MILDVARMTAHKDFVIPARPESILIFIIWAGSHNMAMKTVEIAVQVQK